MVSGGLMRLIAFGAQDEFLLGKSYFLEFEFNGKEYKVSDIIRCNKNYTSTASSPLMYLVVNSKKLNCDDKIYEYMLNNKEELNKQNDIGYSPLMLACGNIDILDNNYNIIKLLICAKCDVNLVDEDGNNALLLICKYSKEHDTENTENIMNIVKLLIYTNINLNVQNNKGYNALTYILKRHHEYKYNVDNIIKILLDTNINLELKDNNNESSLEIICKYASKKIVKDCFNKNPCNEIDLIKYIRIAKHKSFLVSLLAKIYVDKLIYFKAY